MIFDVKTVRPLALAAAVIGLAIPAVMFVPVSEGALVQ